MDKPASYSAEMMGRLEGAGEILARLSKVESERADLRRRLLEHYETHRVGKLLRKLMEAVTLPYSTKLKGPVIMAIDGENFRRACYKIGLAPDMSSLVERVESMIEHKVDIKLYFDARESKNAAASIHAMEAKRCGFKIHYTGFKKELMPDGTVLVRQRGTDSLMASVVVKLCAELMPRMLVYVGGDGDHEYLLRTIYNTYAGDVLVVTHGACSKHLRDVVREVVQIEDVAPFVRPRPIIATVPVLRKPDGKFFFFGSEPRDYCCQLCYVSDDQTAEDIAKQLNMGKYRCRDPKRPRLRVCRVVDETTGTPRTDDRVTELDASVLEDGDLVKEACTVSSMRDAMAGGQYVLLAV
jgi:hypothetical protein